MRECREVSGRSQAFIVFISVFVMKINYTKTRYKQIYENKFLFVLCCAVLCCAVQGGGRNVRLSRLPGPAFQERMSGRQQLLRIACNDVAKGDLLAGIS
ncbi:putative membrane protein [Pseudomonas syringae pv. avii]|uniref:Membrane protein n=1 Tax=Pseudomonas syringae pv. avii TaxID=663959 RepID=A0ABY1U3P6_PSESX|nr:putative membrane protein [Pseudomonas syringae pv. avii]